MAIHQILFLNDEHLLNMINFKKMTKIIVYIISKFWSKSMLDDPVNKSARWGFFIISLSLHFFKDVAQQGGNITFVSVGLTGISLLVGGGLVGPGVGVLPPALQIPYFGALCICSRWIVLIVSLDWPYAASGLLDLL